MNFFGGEILGNKKGQRPWSKLDNAAKIFPSTADSRDTKVFRCCCELYEDIDKEVLINSLNLTLERFPFYKSVLKKGIFWYYLEYSSIEPVVREEYRMPCAPIYSGIKKSLLFEVTYFGNRINLEVYHALSDGTGALNFLKTLVFYYLKEKHSEVFDGKNLMVDYNASETEKVDDSFFKYYVKKKLPFKEKAPRAFRFKEEYIDTGTIRVIEGRVSVKKLLEISHENNCTLTAFLLGILFKSIGECMAMRDKSKPVVICVPVNLRNFFESESARNFFGVVKIEYNFMENSSELSNIINYVDKALKDKVTIEKLSERMSRLSALENKFAAKIIPVIIKNPIMKIAALLEDKGITAAFSNVGRIDMPEELKPYIKLFDVFASTKKLQVCLCSYNDNCVISFTSQFVSTDVQRKFFKTLSGYGLDVEITTNLDIKENDDAIL
jgi:hypothetical protein